MGSTTIVRSDPAVLVTPEIERHSEEIREQLGRVLASPLFKSSKHYTGLLRYVVERAIEGAEGRLKERALGKAVFGRDPDYDTNLDPVVRTSACEVRKRLAQYYSDPAHEAEIRIDLPAGSYVPEFRFPVPVGPVLATPATPAAPLAEPAPAAEPPLASTEGWSRTWYWLAAAMVAAASLAITVAGVRSPRTAVERFWNPVWDPSELVTIYVAAPYNPDPEPASPAAPDGPSYLEVMRNDRMAFGDALTMSWLTGLLRDNGKQFEVRRGTASTLADFRRGPAVLIGAYNNDWTMRLENQLRFTFERYADGPGGFIRDRQNAGRVWSHHPERPYSRITEDYAIVSRFVDSRTEQTIVVVAGMGKDGTIAAGEFVTQPRYLEMLAAAAPKGWERKNLQVVIATELINGNAAPPRILATHFW
jgi:hypothetical protein